MVNNCVRQSGERILFESLQIRPDVPRVSIVMPCDFILLAHLASISHDKLRNCATVTQPPSARKHRSNAPTLPLIITSNYNISSSRIFPPVLSGRKYTQKVPYFLNPTKGIKRRKCNPKIVGFNSRDKKSLPLASLQDTSDHDSRLTSGVREDKSSEGITSCSPLFIARSSSSTQPIMTLVAYNLCEIETKD